MYSVNFVRNVTDAGSSAFSFSSVTGAGTFTLSIPQAERRRGTCDGIHNFRYLEVVDVNMHRVFVVVEVRDLPFLNGIQSRLNQRNVGERVVGEFVGEGLRIAVAGLLVSEPTGHCEIAGHVGRHRCGIHERGVGIELLSELEGSRLSFTLVWRRTDQLLSREREESVRVTDHRRVDGDGSEFGGRIVGTVVGVENAWIAHRLRTFERWHLQHQIAGLRHRHCDCVSRGRRNHQPGSVPVHGWPDLVERVSVLPYDGELRMGAGCGFRQRDRHVGKVADVGKHPDLGLPRLQFQRRLELTVHGVLHIALVVRQ